MSDMKRTVCLLRFFIAHFFVRVARAAAQDQAAIHHGLPLHPSFCLGEVPSESNQDPQCTAKYSNWSI